MDEIARGSAKRLGEAGGVILHGQVGAEVAGVWLRREANEFVWLDGATSPEVVAFSGFAGTGSLTLYPDRRRLLHRVEGRLELWHCSGGLLATAALPSPPPSPFAMDRGAPQWDGSWFTQGHRHLWYCGWDEDGLPLLYLFDGGTLELLDTCEPHSALWGEPERIDGWGDFGADEFCLFPDREPIGFFGNVGDSFGHFGMYEVRDGRIARCGTHEVEHCVQRALDERVFFVRLLRPDTLLACDDLGLVSVIDLGAEEFVQRAVHPLEALFDDDETSDELFQLREMVDGSGALYLRYEVDEYATEDELEALDDFSPSFFVMLDSTSLRPLALLAEADLAPAELVELLPGGLLAAQRGDSVTLYQWMRP